MISVVFHALIYDPLYNGLIFLISVIPTHDVGLAVIALTIVVRIILYPLSRRAVDAQVLMRKLNPEIEALKEKYKTDKQEQGKAIFALYKENGVHPFASVLLLLVQLPILIALYWVFAKGGLPEVSPALLYSFVAEPASINMHFLGFLDMSGHSIVLGVLAGLTQFLYTRISMGPRVKSTSTAQSFSGDFAKSIDLQSRYVLPATFVFLSFIIPNAALLYLVTSNTFMVLQELAAGRRFNDAR